jgi:catechol 2,3-dioxygenase-like lactoylglutathione lyase family enzyme
MTTTVKSGAVIFAKDVSAVARFYEGVLPMTIIAEEDGAIRLENDSVLLVVHALPKAIAKQIEISVPPKLRAQAAIKPVFAVDSLERVRDVAPSLGGGMNPASSAFVWSGFRACDGHDPEGNQVQFREAADAKATN